MSAKYFLDTNLFVYSFDRAAPRKTKIADTLIREAIAKRTGVVSYQVVQEFFNVALRRFTPVMEADEAQQYLATIFRPLLSVQSSATLYAEALPLQQKAKLSWYDSLIVVAALEAGCVVLYSEDLQDGQEFSGLTVKNPFL